MISFGISDQIQPRVYLKRRKKPEHFRKIYIVTFSLDATIYFGV